MTEPPHEQQTVADITGDLVAFEPSLRGIVVFTIDLGGVCRVTLGGAVHIAEVRRMIQTL